MKHHLFLFVFLTAMVVGSGAAEYRGGPERAGYFPGTLVWEDGAATRPVVLAVEADAMQLNYIDDASIELPVKCTLHALDARTGEPLWVVTPPGAIYRDFTLAPGGLAVNYSWDQHYYCFDVRTGEQRWRVKDEGPSGSAAVAIRRGSNGNDGMVLTGALALTLEDGKEIWKAAIDPARLELAPAVGEHGRIYSGANAINAQTGKTIWSANPPKRTTTAALLTQGEVIVGGEDGILYALDREAGTLRWFRTLDAMPISTAASPNERLVYCITSDGRAIALRADGGGEEWAVTTISGFDNQAVAGVGFIVAHAREGAFVALDAHSGEELWKIRMKEDAGPLAVAPALGHSLLIVADGHWLRCFSTAADGVMLWERWFDRRIDWAHPLLTD